MDPSKLESIAKENTDHQRTGRTVDEKSDGEQEPVLLMIKVQDVHQHAIRCSAEAKHDRERETGPGPRYTSTS